MSSTMGFQRMGRKLDLEKKERFTFHLLLRDETPGGVQSRNIVDAIDHSKRVVIILSAYVSSYFSCRNRTLTER